MDYTKKFRYKRINIVGTSSSGKTTFGKSLSAVLGIDYIEMDEIFWGPNWYWPTDEEFFSNLRKVLKEKDTWILDGNYIRTIPIKWEKVELVIWLDYSFIRTLLQALKRSIIRSFTKEELWAGTGNHLKKVFLAKTRLYSGQSKPIKK